MKNHYKKSFNWIYINFVGNKIELFSTLEKTLNFYTVSLINIYLTYVRVGIQIKINRVLAFETCLRHLIRVGKNSDHTTLRS